MKITHAIWDDKSLGVKTFEVLLTNDDSIEAYLEQEKQLIQDEKAEYICVKVPTGISDYIFGLEQSGYCFVETGIAMSLKKSEYQSPLFLSKFDHDTKIVSLKNASQAERVFVEIKKGMFAFDRFAIDPFFSLEIGSQRCVNWISSLLENGHPIFEVVCNSESVGFFILEPIDKKTIKGVLTGVYGDNPGAGLIVMKQLKEHVWSAGYEKYLAQVSSNNLSALRANLLFGSTIEDMTYTYVKHLKRG